MQRRKAVLGPRHDLGAVADERDDHVGGRVEPCSAVNPFLPTPCNDLERSER